MGLSSICLGILLQKDDGGCVRGDWITLLTKDADSASGQHQKTLTKYWENIEQKSTSFFCEGGGGPCETYKYRTNSIVVALKKAWLANWLTG